MVYCGPGNRLIDPPNHLRWDRIPRDNGTNGNVAVKFKRGVLNLDL